MKSNYDNYDNADSTARPDAPNYAQTTYTWDEFEYSVVDSVRSRKWFPDPIRAETDDPQRAAWIREVVARLRGQRRSREIERERGREK